MSRCDLCGAELVRKTARRGPNTGQDFLGCPNYKKGQKHTTRDLPSVDFSESTSLPDGEPLQTKVNPLQQKIRNPQSVLWSDATMENRGDWSIRYLKSLGALRAWSFESYERISKEFSTMWLAASDLPSYSPADEETRRVIGMMQKVLNRGVPTPIPTSSEKELLNQIEDLKTFTNLAVPGLPFLTELDLQLEFGSTFEKELFGKYPKALQRYLTPQAPLDQLVSGLGQDSEGFRRVDLLYSNPYQPLMVYEVDGGQHLDSELIDEERDEILSSVGIKVQRIKTEEVKNWKPESEDIDVSNDEWNKDQINFFLAPVEVHRLMIGILEGLRLGFISGDTWNIKIKCESELTPILIFGYLKVLDAIDSLWGKDLAPRVAYFTNQNGSHFSWEKGSKEITKIDQAPKELDLEIELDTFGSPLEPIPNRKIPTIIIRTTFLPVSIIERTIEPSTRTIATSSDVELDNSLLVILQEIFAKESFREGQLAAIKQVLSGKDCVVLLPTGAGKSLIYQVAGLVLPGRTLVIDPLVALMEDQVRRLKEEGIDKINEISGFTSQLGLNENLLRLIERGESYFTFISPERLQNKSFRSSLKKLALGTPINLVVIDEAHCISEWGHDFRTAYLNIGNSIREICQDSVGKPPPIIAMTGTASRSVLRDVLAELAIFSASSGTLIKPSTFDRKELHYKVVKTKPGEESTHLIGVLDNLPNSLGIPDQQFFLKKGINTNCGIIFTPHVNGDYGALSVARQIESSKGFRVPFYSGSAPKGFETKSWDYEKRRNAADFVNNEAPILVTTKSFGMGIDKPNIRFVIHYGIPGSIESYYQEVGRAGRDRKDAHCFLIFSELDEKKNRALLDIDVDINEISLPDDQSYANRDDIYRQLWFHKNSFAGIDSELFEISTILDCIDDFAGRKFIEIPMGSTKKTEKAIHRLVLLGVVEDYTMDWGSKKIEVLLRPLTIQDIKQNLVTYVDNAQPGRGLFIEEKLYFGAETKVRTAIEQSSRELVIFIYDTIEKARRRSLREMWLAARECTSEQEIRKRILDYLTEGELAPRLENLIDEKLFSYKNWFKEIDLINSSDVGELRGTAARFLGSYPDHPGLLFARGAAELIDEKGSLEEAHSSLEKSFKSAIDLYKSSHSDIEEVANDLVQVAKNNGNGPAIGVVASALTATNKESNIDWIFDIAGEDLTCAIVTLDHYIERALETAKVISTRNGGW